MDHHHHHFLEKLQVQLAAVAALVVVYLALGPVLGWWDPQWPTIFVPSASFAQLAGFAGIIWVLAVACSLVTVSSRPEGALLAALLGAAGVSLHSAPMRAALWRYEEGQGVLFALLIGEVVLLAVVLSAAELVVYIVRSGVAHCRPGWMWPGRVPPAGWRAGGDVGSDVPHEPLANGEGSDAQETWVMQRFVMARIGVLAVLFALPAYSVFQDPEVASSLSKFYPDAPHVARTFLGLIHFFVWSVAAYMMVLVPSLNMEYDHRRLARKLGEQYRELTRKRIGLRVLAWVGVSAGMIGVMLLLT